LQAAPPLYKEKFNTLFCCIKKYYGNFHFIKPVSAAQLTVIALPNALLMKNGGLSSRTGIRWLKILG